MTEANYMDTMSRDKKPSISNRVWRMISALRPGGRRHYREKDSPFGVNPHPRRYHQTERRKRRRQVKHLMHHGEWKG